VLKSAQRFVLLSTAAMCVAPYISAQTAVSTIAGRAVDASGASIPGAQVTVRNTDVGTVRTLTTDGNGGFRSGGLPPGAYTVEAKAAGLNLRRPVRVTLTLGSSVELALRLEVATHKESTTVRARPGTVEGNTTAPPSDTTEAATGTFLPGLTVTYLPSRDRDFTQFTSQTAAAEDDPDGVGVSLAGQRSNATATQVDGISYNDALLGGRRGAEDGGTYLPIGVVREFQVLRSGVDSSVGQTGSGLINVATKNGGNRGRGDAYYTVRPAPWTSADAFGNSTHAMLQSFGLAEAGAIRKNVLFYSAGFQQDFVHAPQFSLFAPQAAGIVVPAALTSQQGQVMERQTPTAGFSRLDWVLNARNTLTGSIALDHLRSSNAGDGLARSLAAPSLSADFGGQSSTARISLATVLSERAFNQAAVAYSNDHRSRTPHSTAPELFINGFGVLGGDADGVHRYTSQQWQVLDDVMLTRGRNGLTFGGRFAASPAYEYREQNTNGRFDYTSLLDYLNNAPRRFQQTILTAPAPAYSATVNELALYVSERLQLRPSLYLTAGLRWAGQWNPLPTQGTALIPTTAASGIVPALNDRLPNDVKQWQPRLGLAWTPRSGTTMRLSSGIYTAPTPATFFHRVFTDGGAYTATLDSLFDPSLLALAGGNTSAPHALSSVPAGATMTRAQVVGMDAAFRNPSSLQIAASIEQQVTKQLGFTAGYLHNSTWGLERQIDQNLNAPVAMLNGNAVFPVARPNPLVGRFLVEQSRAHSNYDGGYLSVKAPLSARSTILANYTMSHAQDDDSSIDPYNPVTVVNPFALRAEKSNSLLDTRHALNINAIFNLPAGFKANPLLVARSGLPYTPIVGFDTQGDANDRNDRAMVAGAVAGRNSQRQPAFASLDMRLVKDFTLKGEGHHLDLFLDVFNLTGTQNRRFDTVGQSFFGDAAHPVFSAGQPLFAPGVTQLGGPRAIQFTARLVGF
jgi:hypothetical protein